MKNDHFSKIEPYESFYKNDHFSLNFTSHFLVPFSSSASGFLTFSQSPCNLSTCSLWHQRQRKEWQLPNPSLVHPAPNEPENLHRRLQTLLRLIPLMKRMTRHSCCNQPRFAARYASPGRQPELSGFSTGWRRTLWIDTSSFLTLRRMPKTRDEENVLRKGPNLNFTS